MIEDCISSLLACLLNTIMAINLTILINLTIKNLFINRTFRSFTRLDLFYAHYQVVEIVSVAFLWL